MTPSDSQPINVSDKSDTPIANTAVVPHSTSTRTVVSSHNTNINNNTLTSNPNSNTITEPNNPPTTMLPPTSSTDPSTFHYLNLPIYLFFLCWICLSLQKLHFYFEWNAPDAKTGKVKPFPVYYVWHPVLNSLGVAFMGIGVLVPLRERKVAVNNVQNSLSQQQYTGSTRTSQSQNASPIDGTNTEDSNQIVYARSSDSRSLHITCQVLSAICFFTAYGLMYHQHEINPNPDMRYHFGKPGDWTHKVHVWFGYSVLLCYVLQVVGGILKWNALVVTTVIGTDSGGPKSTIKWHGIVGRVVLFLTHIVVIFACFLDLKDSYPVLQKVLIGFYIIAGIEAYRAPGVVSVNGGCRILGSGVEDDEELSPVLDINSNNDRV